MNVFSKRVNEINNVEDDYLVSFFHERFGVLMALREDHQSSSVLWDKRNPANLNKVIGHPYVAIDFSYQYFLALEEDGKLRSWDRWCTNKRIHPNTAFTSIAAGDDHVALLRDDGRLEAWGANDYGQTDIPDGTYTAIAAGGEHSVALKNDGKLVAWGNNNHGQINVPDGTYTAIAAGNNHSLALRDDGRLAAWGDNGRGQAEVDDGTYTAIAARVDSSLALRDDDELVIFGDIYRRIGDIILARNRPSIANGSHHTFIIKPNGDFFIFDNRRPNPDLD